MAGRIRTIKPELREHDGFSGLSDGAARLFLMLYTLVDDTGSCPADPGFLAGAVFFRRPKPLPTIGRLLLEIETAGLVRRYEVARAPFLTIVGWSEKGTVTHQRIEKPQGPRYPQPGSIHSGNGSGNSEGNSRNHSGTDQDLRPLTSDLRAREAPSRSNVERIPEPSNPPPPKPDAPPLERADRPRSSPDPRIKLNHDAWTHAREEHGRLRESGVDPSAIRWPLMPVGAAQGDLVARTRELTSGDSPDYESAREVHRRRVAVAVAEAKREGHLRWFTPTQFYTSERFYRAAEMSPEQAAVPRRAGPLASEPALLRQRDRGDDAPRLSTADSESFPLRTREGSS